MAITINGDAAVSSPISFDRSDEGNTFWRSVSKTINGVTAYVVQKVTGSTQTSKDGTRRVMLKMTFPIPTTAIAGGDPLAGAKAADVSLHAVLALDARVVRLLENNLYREGILDIIGEGTQLLTAVMLGNGSPVCSDINGEKPSLKPFLNGVQGNWPLADGAYYGHPET